MPGLRSHVFLAVAVTLGVACAAAAETADEPPSARATPPAEEDRLAASPIERMSEEDLKAFYLHCSREAMRQRLGGGEIALCSMGYERLLKGTFRGDFHALLEWRRGLRRPPEPLQTPF